MQNHWLQNSSRMFDGVVKISFNTLICPQVHAGNLNKKRAIYRTRLNPSLAIQASSVLQIEESGELPKQISGSFAAAKRCQIPFGIIGGVSVVSTLIFLEKLVWWSSRSAGESVPFIVCSDPAISKQFAVQGPLNGKDGNTHLDRYSIIENLRQKRAFLEQSGVRCIVMPCHISHVWHEEISQGCSVPFLNVGDCVARELKEAEFKPLEAGSNVRIGVLAKDLTSMALFYKNKLQSQGFEVVLPDKPTMEHAVIPAVAALKNKDMEGAQNLLRIAIQVLLVRAVNTVILAGDEFRGVLPLDDPLLKRCIDPMDALARSTITWGQTSDHNVYHNTF